MIPVHMVSFVRRLQRPEQRQGAARDLAAHVGAEHVLVFGKDLEIGVFLPAPGLSQTLQQGVRWQTFLNRCAQEGEARDGLPDPSGTGELPAFGITDSDRLCVLVFLGAEPDDAICGAITELLPLLGAKLVDERVALAATGHAVAAREATRKAQSLNEALVKNRYELREAIERAEKELASRRVVENQLLDADRRKDEFLAMLAHELRNPLGAISNAIKLMEILENDASGTAVKAHETIRRQVAHLTRLVNDLIDMSRISRGKVTLKVEQVLVSDFISTAIEIVQHFVESRHHRLTILQPEHPVRMTGDRARLIQIVGNLLHNAAKYTPQYGEIILDVMQEADELIISVRDNGIGIAPEATADIFRMFSQADHAPDKVQEGLGVGLALVKEFAVLHGGSVSASSDGPGRGSVFTVRLPTHLEPSSGAAAPLSSEAAPKKGRRILLVDDNEDAIDMLKMLLECDGHEIRTAHDGASAIETATDFSFEIVFLDIGLPDMSGYQVARALRRLPAMNGATLVALTGMGQEKDRKAGADAGLDHYMVKPLDFGKLRAIIGSLDK
jgi:signal transduction histidine kinase/CheY-like chemotaxis protein